MIYGYGRVSTTEQNLDRQLDMLKANGAEGLKAARARGRVGGRPRADEKQVKKAILLYRSGNYTVREIEELTGVKKSTLYRYMKEF